MLWQLCVAAPPALAEIYRYQDEQGNWVFTDRPPPEQLGTAAPAPAAEPRVRIQRLPDDGPTTGAAAPRRPPPITPGIAPPAPPPRPVQPAAPAPPTAATAPPLAAPPEPEPEPEAPPPDLRRDLEARLNAQFSPVSPVEASSLAVVTVTSELGAGSGFFVSDDGLLLTNRHVVRPPPDWAADQEAALAELKAQLDALEQRLSLPRDRYSDPQNYDRGQRLLRERGREYRQGKRELEMKRNAALLQRAFEIQLKDGERLTAELVDLSPLHDLALLRVSGYRTPFIRPLFDARLRQTQRVYAIGSPLGITDTVTAGTYTGKREDMLVTDARIMPGNSGGPLVTELGAVVGVNTWKATPGPDPQARGFGISIPIDIAFREFPDLQARLGRAGGDAPAP